MIELTQYIIKKKIINPRQENLSTTRLEQPEECGEIRQQRCLSLKKKACNADAKLSLFTKKPFFGFFWSVAEACVRYACLNLEHHGNGGTSHFSLVSS